MARAISMPRSGRNFATLCTVQRVWEGEGDERGVLVHTQRAALGVLLRPRRRPDDEPIFKFDRHVFKEGEYVAITEHDGKTRPFKVVSVQPHIVAGGESAKTAQVGVLISLIMSPADLIRGSDGAA